MCRNENITSVQGWMLLKAFSSVCVCLYMCCCCLVGVDLICLGGFVMHKRVWCIHVPMYVGTHGKAHVCAYK